MQLEFEMSEIPAETAELALVKRVLYCAGPGAVW